ncbi:MAG: SET domain-containing protein-lysine N-methyltransferase [Planctomycetes bacterium]|nr:SET domain-containing protein-lysine N-methyltransferase [Planctomycetota bacterium]
MTATATTFPALLIRHVEGRGRCIIAAQDIAKGTQLLADHTVFVPKADSQYTDLSVVGRYLFEWNDEGDLCIVLGLGSLINHSKRENVSLVSNDEDRTMDFFALTDIAAGEELVYDYGHDVDELANYYGIPAD